MRQSTPSLSQLYQLAEQLDHDREVSMQVLRERDHAIGLQCKEDSDSSRLMFWLEQMSSRRPDLEPLKERWLTEASAASILRTTALVLGFLSMATLLLASGRGLVNLIVFLAVFVFLQLLMSIVSSVLLFRTLRGGTPVILPLHPGKVIISRLFPDKRYLREIQSLVRMVFLRYGQEFGALFTLGAIAAFFVVLTLSDFTFVWGSTFSISDDMVVAVTDAMALPWSTFAEFAVPSAQVVADTRFHPALVDLSQARIESMRGWWPFLIMSMVVYAFIPRLILWVASKIGCARLLRASFLQYPGADLVLVRMSSPLVKTQADSPGTVSAIPVATNHVSLNKRLILLNWASALATEDLLQYEAFRPVPEQNVVTVGLQSLERDLELVEDLKTRDVEKILVAVKAWESPIADLADFLAEFSHDSQCVLILVPLPGRSISEDNMAQWRVFTRQLPFAVVDVQALNRA